MNQNRAAARRKRVRDRRGDSERVWLQRLWNFVVRPQFVGALLLVAGLVVMLAPTASVPASPSHGWWIAAYRFTNAAQGGVTLIVGAAMLALAVAFEIGSARQRGNRSMLPIVAVALMGTGMTLGLLTWFVGQAEVPTSRVSIAPGQTIEAFPAIESGRSFKVMLPMRIFVDSVDPTMAKASVELRKPGDKEGVKNDIFVGDPLDVAGYRFALVGMELDPRVRTAVLKADDGIEVRASVASKVRFVPDGPQYEVKQIASNYLGVMGPAVELEEAEAGRFWVFERDGKLDKPLSKIHLERLESAPVPVFAVAKTNAGQAAPAAALLFLLGLGLFVLVRDRGSESLNELGPALEDT